jgi:hypothetical protein
VDTEQGVKLSETYKTAVAKWRKASQMDKVEILILIMAVVIFLALVLALISLEASGFSSRSGDRGALRGEPERELASLSRSQKVRKKRQVNVRSILADEHPPLPTSWELQAS